LSRLRQRGFPAVRWRSCDRLRADISRNLVRVRPLFHLRGECARESQRNDVELTPKTESTWQALRRAEPAIVEPGPNSVKMGVLVMASITSDRRNHGQKWVDHPDEVIGDDRVLDAGVQRQQGLASGASASVQRVSISLQVVQAANELLNHGRIAPCPGSAQATPGDTPHHPSARTLGVRLDGTAPLHSSQIFSCLPVRCFGSSSPRAWSGFHDRKMFS